MILRKFLSLLNLAEIQILCIYKLVEIIIISEDKNLIFVVFQVIILSLEIINNSQKLLIISLILSFYRNYLFQNIGYYVLLTILD